jgi:hypothetical protein
VVRLAGRVEGRRFGARRGSRRGDEKSVVQLAEDGASVHEERGERDATAVGNDGMNARGPQKW